MLYLSSFVLLCDHICLRITRKKRRKRRRKTNIKMIIQHNVTSRRPYQLTDELEKAKFYVGEAHTYFDFMNEARRKLDDKIYNMITLSGVLITIVFGAMTFVNQRTTAMTPITIGFSAISACSFLIAVIFGLIAYKPSNIPTRDISAVIEKYELGKEEFELESPIQHIAWNLSKDANMNADIAKRKGKWFRRMLYTFFFGLAFLIVALVSLI